MGTIIFSTDETAGQILQREMNGAGRIRMFTTAGDSACVALRVELDSDEARRHILRTYDLPDNAHCAVIAVVFKQSGLNGKGQRPVSLKAMTEEMGPYYTGGANRQLLNTLSPLRKDAAPYAQEWRDRAYAAIGKATALSY